MKNITNSVKIVFQFRYTCTVFKLLGELSMLLETLEHSNYEENNGNYELILKI